MVEKMLLLLCERPYIPCEPLSTDEIIERMIKAKSRRSVPPPKKMTTNATSTKPKRSKVETTQKAAAMDELKHLIATGMDMGEAMQKVGLA